MSLDSILRATGKNLANCGEKANWYSPISVLTNLTVSDGVVSLPAVSAGSGMALNKNRIFTNGETFIIHANHTSPTGDIPENQYRYILKPYKNNTVVKDITITGWTYNQYYNAYWSSGTSKSFTLPKDTVNSFEWGLGFLAYGNISAGTVLTYSNIQIEKGSTATTYEPYEYLGPKTINLGSGSSGKEVLKVSYNSRNLFDKTNYSVQSNNNAVRFDISKLKIGEQYTISSNLPLYWIKISNSSDGWNSVQQTSSTGIYNYTFIMQRNPNIPASVTTQYLFLGIENGKMITDINAIVDYNIQVELGDKVTDYVPYFNTTVWTKKA